MLFLSFIYYLIKNKVKMKLFFNYQTSSDFIKKMLCCTLFDNNVTW